MNSLNNFQTFRYVWRSLLASILMAGSAILFKDFGVGTLVNVFLCMAAYPLFLWLLREPLLKEFRPSSLLS